MRERSRPTTVSSLPLRRNLFEVAQVVVGFLLHVIDHEVRVFDGPAVVASGDVNEAAALIGHDADDAVMLVGHAEVFGCTGLRIVGEHIATGVIAAFLTLLFVGIALLGADINLAGELADIVAGMNLGLGGEPGEEAHDGAVDVDHHPHDRVHRVELDQVRVDAVLGGADVDLVVVSSNDGEVAAFLVGVF